MTMIYYVVRTDIDNTAGLNRHAGGPFETREDAERQKVQVENVMRGTFSIYEAVPVETSN